MHSLVHLASKTGRRQPSFDKFEGAVVANYIRRSDHCTDCRSICEYRQTDASDPDGLRLGNIERLPGDADRE